MSDIAERLRAPLFEMLDAKAAEARGSRALILAKLRIRHAATEATAETVKGMEGSADDERTAQARQSA